MKLDPEIKEEFVSEVKLISKELNIELQKIIETKLESTQHFTNFGQKVDRIYGTCTTLGFMEIGKYLLSIKDLSYMAGDSENRRGHEKAFRLLVSCLKYLEEVPRVIESEEAMDKIRFNMNLDAKKVDVINRKEFFSITKKSCD